MIVPVILSGGSGTRLWPLSRSSYPKQFLSVNGHQSLLQETALRVAGTPFTAPIAVTNEEQRFLLAHHLLGVECPARKILLEPVGRNTAPAVAVAALFLSAEDDALMLVSPADHVIVDPAAFRRAVEAGVPHAETGRLVTFGVRPSHAHTGYGYIEAGSALAPDGAATVERFIEKPELGVAERFVAEGTYFWNSGIFLFRPRSFLAELERHAPDIVAACRGAVAAARQDGDFIRLDKAEFEKSPALSIDYAVMERTESAVVVPVDMGWSDVGSWSALWDIGAKDRDGNVSDGDVVLYETSNTYVRSEGPLVTAIGIADMVIVATEDAVLVAPKTRAEDVRQIVDRLKAAGRSEPDLHRLVHRPWGTYRTISLGDRFQVKEIIVKPGASLSLQMHHHRAEHWVVVQGTAEVTRGDTLSILHENQSIFIPLGTRHRLANPGKLDLRVIEVQSGSYLGEDDIVRFEDNYGRVS